MSVSFWSVPVEILDAAQRVAVRRCVGDEAGIDADAEAGPGGGVDAAAADDGVGADIAEQDVVAGAAFEQVGAIAAVDEVVVLAAEQRVVAEPAVERVVAAAAPGPVVVGAAEELVVGVAEGVEGDEVGIGVRLPLGQRQRVDADDAHDAAEAAGEQGVGAGNGHRRDRREGKAVDADLEVHDAIIMGADEK